MRYNRELVAEFAQKVLLGNYSFELKSGKRCFYFCRSDVGEAGFIYGRNFFDEKDVYSDWLRKAEVVAIAAGGKVYIVDDSYFWTWDETEEKLPENVVSFYEKVNEVNNQVNCVLFSAFYNALEIQEVVSEEELTDCEKESRNKLLSLSSEKKEEKPLWKVNGYDVCKALCGVLDIEAEAKQRMENKKDFWILEKSRNEKVKEFIANKRGAAEWELRIAEGLRSLEAVFVTVEFEMDGKTAIGKIAPGVIMEHLIKRECLAEFNFATGVQGKKVFGALGATSYWGERALKCEHINKITYGKKVIYTRDSE